jgi:Holliday junction resolvase RusA-like endonuclease
MYLTAGGRAWKEQVEWLVKHFKPLEGKVAVSLEFVFTDKRRRDAQNHIKLTLDALQGYFYKDDSQIHYLTVIKRHGEKPMTLIECRSLNETC